MKVNYDWEIINIKSLKIFIENVIIHSYIWSSAIIVQAEISNNGLFYSATAVDRKP